MSSLVISIKLEFKYFEKGKPLELFIYLFFCFGFCKIQDHSFERHENALHGIEPMSPILS